MVSEANRTLPVPGGSRRETGRVDRRSLEHDLRHSVEGEVRFDDGTRAAYAVDASNYRQVPIGVVVPRSIEDVVATTAICHDHRAPLLSRGGGTSLAGQCCNVAVVMDFSKYLTELLEIDADDRTARVRPGLVCDALRDRSERHHGLTFGPDPATHAWCTFGGMLGNNSCGVHSVLSGRTADNVREMEILTHDGVRMRVGATTEEEIERIIRAGGRPGEIFRGLKEIRDRYGDIIRERYPAIPRRVSGYNLDELLPEKGFNVARALVGSEGTCATILEARVELVPSPSCRALVVLGYRDVFTAADHVLRILEHGPTGLEGLDSLLLDAMETKGMHVDDIDLLPEGGGWLLVELGGETEREAEEKARELMAELDRETAAPSMKLCTDPEARRIWAIRESGLGATARAPGTSDTWPGWEDAAVHPENLGDYLRDFQKLLDAYDYRASLYGHFGQACVHSRIDFDLRSEDGIGAYRRFLDDAADLVMRYDGSFSGEHGDGQARGALLERMFGDELIDAFRTFKSLWDPDWLMNPGKVVRPNAPDENLKLGDDYRPWQPVTHFRYPDDDGSFSRAVLRCVGVGRCRRRDDAFMCPSFIPTHEEEHSTRGRARLLYEMLQRDVIADGWESDAVRGALDLCLGCKGCKKECPVGVDMATYKAEFLSHFYQGRLRPRSDYAFANIGVWARGASMMPAAANYFAQTEPFASMLKWFANIAHERTLPAVARETFGSWARKNLTRSNDDASPVVLYADVFNDFFHPSTLQAAALSLERLGYRVIVPPGRFPAIRPLIHHGMLRRAKRALEATLERLRPHLDRGIPVVGVEPSTVSVFRDELSSLMPESDAVRRLEASFYSFSEFLDQEDVALPTIGRKALVHGHCHQKSVLTDAAMTNVLEKMRVDFTEPWVGCCGMAGSFGLEADHYRVSVAIGEEKLLPAVRAADAETLVIADGFSCRSQIRERTERAPIHLAELVWMGLRERDADSPRSRAEAPIDFPRASTARVAAIAVGLTVAAFAAWRGWRGVNDTETRRQRDAMATF